MSQRWGSYSLPCQKRAVKIKVQPDQKRRYKVNRWHLLLVCEHGVGCWVEGCLCLFKREFRNILVFFSSAFQSPECLNLSSAWGRVSSWVSRKVGKRCWGVLGATTKASGAAGETIPKYSGNRIALATEKGVNKYVTHLSSCPRQKAVNNLLK